jgi:hypothetical protein
MVLELQQVAIENKIALKSKEGGQTTIGSTQRPKRCPACSGILLVVERLTRSQLYFHPCLNPSEPKRCNVHNS